jgi:hypothetical protein
MNKESGSFFFLSGAAGKYQRELKAGARRFSKERKKMSYSKHHG